MRGVNTSLAHPVTKPADPVVDEAAMARARKELEDSIAQSRALAAPTHKEAEKPSIIESVVLNEEEKKEEIIVAPTATQKVPDQLDSSSAHRSSISF